MTPHGTVSGYVNHGCRCDKCRAASATATHRQREERRGGPLPEWVQHGDLSTYSNWLCRCEECGAAMSAYNKAYRVRKAAQ
jgi:hypothetical protein